MVFFPGRDVAAFCLEDEDSETEEERLGEELENFLYSRIHHAEAAGDEVAIFDVFNVMTPSKKEESEVIPLNSGIASLAASSPEVVDLDSDSDDDGIQVLDRPQAVVSGRLVTPEVIDVGSSPDSSSSELDITDWTEIIKEKKKIKKPITETRKRRVTEQQSVVPIKKRKEELQKYVAMRNSSESSSSDSDLEDFSTDPVNLSLNLTGTPDKVMIRSLSDFIGEENDASKEKSAVIHRWTDDMHKFYDDIDEEAATITTEAILESFKYNPDDWKISSDDLYASKNGSSPWSGSRGSRYYQSYRNSGPKCHNCNKSGHMQRNCPEPQKPTICTMCSDVGHRAEHCFNQICLQCGSPDGRYERPCRHCLNLAAEYCRQCGMPGHMVAACPDNWRRFHATIDPTAEAPVQPAEDCHKAAIDTFCYNCGKKGHYLDHCRAYTPRRSGPLGVLQVCSYAAKPHVPAWMQNDLEPLAEETTLKSNRERKRADKELKRRKLKDMNRSRAASVSLNEDIEEQVKARKGKQSSRERWRWNKGEGVRENLKSLNQFRSEKAAAEFVGKRGFHKKFLASPKNEISELRLPSLDKCCYTEAVGHLQQFKNRRGQDLKKSKVVRKAIDEAQRLIKTIRGQKRPGKKLNKSEKGMLKSTLLALKNTT
jgi:hypothetical protein